MAILSDEFYYQPIRIDTINTRVFADIIAKEGDANGRGLLLTLTENGLMKDTTGINLNLKWEHTSVGNQGLDNFEAVDLSKGLYKITYPTEMLNRGKVRAFIQIIDSGKLAGTRNIEITVDRGVGDDTAIASSDSFTALAQALIDVNNLESTYAPRLLSAEQQLEQAAIKTQPDFVTDLNKLSSAKQKMNLQILVGNLKQFFVNIQLSDTKGVAYACRRNGQDDYIYLMEGIVGDINRITSVVNTKNNETELGTFLKTAPNYYTATINDWIATTFTGTKITFNSYKNNAGGLWEAILDEGTADERRINISVYSTTAVTVAEQVLFENLDNKKHTIKMVFKGQDPTNPVASPRGWYFYGGTREQDVQRTFNVYGDAFNVVKTTDAMYSYSNKDFALSARPSGSAEPYNFIPEHNAIGTAFNLQDTQLLADGKPITWATGNYYECETIQLIQKIKGVHPSDTLNPLVEVTTYHTFKDGVVTVSGKVKFLRDTQIDVGYIGMLPYFLPYAKKIKTSLGNEYITIADQPNYKEYWPDADGAKSFVVVNDIDTDEKKNIAVAMSYDNFDRTMRVGETGRGNPYSWIEHRGSTMGKIYHQQFQNTTLLAGYEYRFDMRYLVTLLSNVADFVL